VPKPKASAAVREKKDFWTAKKHLFIKKVRFVIVAQLMRYLSSNYV